jgi:integrase
MFRHTFACKLSKRCEFFKIQKLLGHTDIRMTMQYARSLRTEDMRQDVEKISF